MDCIPKHYSPVYSEEKGNNISCLSGVGVRHDTMTKVLVEYLITDLTDMACIFGSKWFTTPFGVRLPMFYSSFDERTKMTTILSLKIRYNIISGDLQVYFPSKTR